MRKMQRAIERQTLGLSLRDRKHKWIRNRTKAIDVNEQTTPLKWKWVDHNEHFQDQ